MAESGGGPIRLGLIGAGIFAREQHTPALLALPAAFQIAAVYSRTPESAARLNALLPVPVDVFHDIAALLARPDIEAVDVALPIHVMPAVVEMALAAGKHVISEKPVAPDVATGRRLLAFHARYPDRVWMISENYRYERPLVRARQVVAAGLIGRPLLADWIIHVPFTPDNKYYRSGWRLGGHYPGGPLLDGGVHHAAGWRFVLGEVATVSAAMTHLREDLPSPDTLGATFRFESGALGSYAVTYAGGAPWYGPLQIVGEAGAVQMWRDGRVAITSGGETRIEQMAGFTGVREGLAAFAAAVRQGVDTPNTPLEALRDVALVEAMLRAAESGAQVAPEQVRAAGVTRR